MYRYICVHVLEYIIYLEGNMSEVNSQYLLIEVRILHYAILYHIISYNTIILNFLHEEMLFYYQEK